MESLLSYFFEIILLQYALLFFIVAVTKRVRFFRLLYISLRETLLLTLVMCVVVVYKPFITKMNGLTSVESIWNWVSDAATHVGIQYVPYFLLLFYGMSIAFNITRQAISFWPILNWVEKLKLVFLPLLLLGVDLAVCASFLTGIY